MADELTSLLDNVIPNGRRNLQESYVNLENVAKFCEDNYLKASLSQKQRALQDTQNYTTHSLASVAYEINNLATNFLRLLDLQLNQLTDLESSVHYLNQAVVIHKEKVARREIGLLTAAKSMPGTIGMKNGIIYPEQSERPIRYVRKSIDYSILDNVGHGLRQPANTTRASRSLSINSTSSGISTSSQLTAAKSPTTPVNQVGPGGGGSLSRNSGVYYITPSPAVAPPSLPPPSTPQPLGNSNHSNSSRSSDASGNHNFPANPSNTLKIGQVRTSAPCEIDQTAAGFNPTPNMLHNMTRCLIPSLMHPHAKAAVSQSNSKKNNSWIETTPLPPPDYEAGEKSVSHDAVSPPLPPPPSEDQTDYFNFAGDTPQSYDFHSNRMGPPSSRVASSVYQGSTRGHEDPYAATGSQLISQTASVPSSYIEKVVAIYDYEANKPDELSFAENAVIYVTNKNDDGWWEGTLDGQTGLFPYNYVEPCMY